MSISDEQGASRMEGLGWIGVGKMGGPLVCVLLETGIEVTLLESHLENRASAIAAGGRPADSVAELVACSDVVFRTPNNDAALRASMFGKGALAGLLRREQVFIDMSTISPRLSEDIAIVLRNRGVPYLRALVSGSTVTARARCLTIVASGPEAV